MSPLSRMAPRIFIDNDTSSSTDDDRVPLLGIPPIPELKLSNVDSQERPHDQTPYEKHPTTKAAERRTAPIPHESTPTGDGWVHCPGWAYLPEQGWKWTWVAYQVRDAVMNAAEPILTPKLRNKRTHDDLVGDFSHDSASMASHSPLKKTRRTVWTPEETNELIKVFRKLAKTTPIGKPYIDFMKNVYRNLTLGNQHFSFQEMLEKASNQHLNDNLKIYYNDDPES